MKLYFVILDTVIYISLIKCQQNFESPHGQLRSLLSVDEESSEECEMGFFKCTLTKKCVLDLFVCDGADDCGDNSDEPGICSVNECLTSKNNCSNLCIDDRNGFHCDCYNGYRLNNQTNICEDINECLETPNICSNRTCINTKGSFECLCEEDRETHPIYPCKTDESKKPKLLFSTRGDIRISNISFYSLDINQTNVLHKPFRSAVAIDYNIRSNYLFWSDVFEKEIYVGPLDKSKPCKLSSANHRVFIKDDISTVDGIAIDWIHDLLYWTDQLRNTLEVASVYNASTRTVIISDLDEPRAIALSVRESFMVWTDWGSAAKIEIAAQDGTNRRTIVSTNLGWPNGVVIDEESRRIYWVDGKLNSIYSCDYNGDHRTLMFSSHTFLAHPFSIDIFQDTIYWSDWQRKSVLKTNKLVGPVFLVGFVVKNINAVMSAKIIHLSKQPLTTNRCQNHKCSNLCLPHNDQCYVCICPTNYVLSSNGFDCIKNTNFSSRAVKITHWSLAVKSILKASNVSKPFCENHGSSEVDFGIDRSTGKSVATFANEQRTDKDAHKETDKRSHISVVPYLVCILFGAVITIVASMVYQHFRKRNMDWQSFNYRRYSRANDDIQTISSQVHN